jgi:hypothetical protein
VRAARPRGIAPRRIPHLVAYQELSTPITRERFTSHAGAAIYGLPGVPERWRIPWFGARTPVGRFGWRLVEAMMGGGRSFPRIFGAAKAFARPRAESLAL